MYGPLAFTLSSTKGKTDAEAFEFLPQFESLGDCFAFGAFVLRSRLARDYVEHSFWGQWSDYLLLCALSS